jgi:hypothetical protein
MAEDFFMFRNLRFAHRIRPIRLSFLAVLFTSCVLSWNVGAEAGIVIDITETGGNVVVNFSGSFTRPESGSNSGGSVTEGITGGSAGNNSVGLGSYTTYDVYTGTSSPSGSSWGTGPSSPLSPTSTVGFTGGMGGFVFEDTPSGGSVYINSSYSDNSVITGSMTFTGQTLASMFLTPQTIVYSFAGSLVATPSTVTVNIVGAPPAGVPEPASLLLLSSIGLAGGYRQFRRKSRRQVAATAPQA